MLESILSDNVWSTKMNIWHVLFSSNMRWCRLPEPRSHNLPTSPQLLSSCHRLQVDHQGLQHCSFYWPPPLPETPLPTSYSCSILSLPWEECWGSTIEAKLFSTSSIFICQTAVAAAARAVLQCFVCWFCWLVCMCVRVCVLTRACVFGCVAACLLAFTWDKDTCVCVWVEEWHAW